ncbi:MAG: deoxyribonuclease IV [Nitrososphaeria archaeon]|nr:deoxyribonuclease IV [Nitrososphaeria archaeon]NIQ32237.1 deoxyribonuclease IV [Nitrososphaeria archaeon]
MKLGVHVSIAGSVDRAFDRAEERGCDTFQIFTRNPRGWKSKDLIDKEVESFRAKSESSGIEPVFGHMPYLPNLASSKDETYEKSVETLIDELSRCARLGIPYLVTHLGSHLGQGKEIGFERIINAINRAVKEAEIDVMLLLENTAGTKNSMGATFEDLRFIIESLDEANRIGICFDTCHAFAAGYDLRNEEALQTTMEKFEEILGFQRLRVVHANDSVGKLGSRLDRHEHIGFGYIGDEGFKVILKHEVLGSLPLILETPVDQAGDDYTDLKKMRDLFQSI